MKAAVTSSGELCDCVSAPELTASLLQPLLAKWHPSAIGLSVVSSPRGLDLLPVELPVLRVNAACPLPITIDYLTPDTLGADRIAAAVGAYKLANGKPCVVIDAGTCITVDLVDENATFCGGAIMPGLDMNFRALHTFTANLPLLSVRELKRTCSSETEIGKQGKNTFKNHRELNTGMTDLDNIAGRSTAQSLQAGVVAATRMALRGMVERHRCRCGELCVMLTGGGGGLFVDVFDVPSYYEPNLVLRGIDEIMNVFDKQEQWELAHIAAARKRLMKLNYC